MKQKIRYKKNYSFKHRKLHKVKYPWLYLTREEFKKLIITKRGITKSYSPFFLNILKVNLRKQFTIENLPINN